MLLILEIVHIYSNMCANIFRFCVYIYPSLSSVILYEYTAA